MQNKLPASVKKICQLIAVNVALLLSFNSYAYDECISINSVLVDKICYENLGDYRTDDDRKQGGFRPSELPQDITDYSLYFDLHDSAKVDDFIADPNYKLYYDHNLDGHTLYLQDNRQHEITFTIKGGDNDSEVLDFSCIIRNVWKVSWVFLKHIRGFFDNPGGTWKAFWTEIQIEECEWKPTNEKYDDEQHIISIDVPINTAHAADAVSIELDKNHLGDQTQFKVTTTYPHAIEATVALSAVADESPESTEIHKERFVLSSENAHYLVPEILDRDHLSENITTTAIVRVAADEKNINIHDDVINHHRRLQEIQLINSLDDMGPNCQHPALPAHRIEYDHCLLESNPLSEASSDFYNMYIQPEQHARYDSWDNTGDATVVRTKVPIDSSDQDNREDSTPSTNRYHIYDNGLASCKITDDLNQRDFPALVCQVDAYATHTLQIDYDHRQQYFDAYLVTEKGKKPLTDIELESLLHHNWQDWIVSNPLDGFPRQSYIFVPDDTTDKRITPENYAPTALFPYNNQYIPIEQARDATKDIDLVTSLLDGFSETYLLHPTIESLDNLAVQSIYQIKQNRSINWGDLDRFLTLSEEDEEALSSETQGLGQWRFKHIRQGGVCDEHWEDYIENRNYEAYLNNCLERTNAVYLALLKVAISDYYHQSSLALEPAQYLISKLNNKFNSLVVFLRLQYIQQAFENLNVPVPDFLRSELTQYGEYDHQAYHTLLAACKENAFCSQLIFDVQHYEIIISDLADQYNRRTNNLNQQLKPLLSGDGLTEFLLALESWEVWDQYQRTLDHGDSQLIVADILDSTYQIGVEENAVKPLIIGPSDDLYYSTEAFMAGFITQEEYKSLLIHTFTIPLELYRDEDGRRYTVDDQTGEWYTLDYDNNRILINPNDLAPDEYPIYYDRRKNALYFKNNEYKTAIWMPDYNLHYLHAPRSLDSRYAWMRFTTVREILLYKSLVEQMESRGSEVYIPDGGGGSEVNNRASAIGMGLSIEDAPRLNIEKIKQSLDRDQASRITELLLDEERRRRPPNGTFCRDLYAFDQRENLDGTETVKSRTEKHWVASMRANNMSYACWTIVVNGPVGSVYMVPLPQPENPLLDIQFALDCDLDNPQEAVYFGAIGCSLTRHVQRITVFYAVRNPDPNPEQVPRISFKNMHARDRKITGFLGTSPYSNLADEQPSLRVFSYNNAFRDAIYLSNVQLQTSQAEDMSYMFAMNIPFDLANATRLTGNFSSWDVRRVTDMSSMFAGESHFYNDAITRNTFNEDISNWIPTSARNLSRMFAHSKFNNGQEAFAYGRPLDWSQSVCNVENAKGMFQYNKSYNQPMIGWQFFRLEDASHMFNGTIFNQDISLWEFADPNEIFADDYDGDGASLTRMDYMFAYSRFNNGILEGEHFQRPLNWRDQVNNVTSARGLFEDNRIFNQAMDNWNFENLIDGSEMFYGAISFNQDLSGWLLPSLQRANEMFWFASGFEGSLSSWDLSNIQGFDQQSNRREFYRYSPHLVNNQNERPRYNGAPLD